MKARYYSQFGIPILILIIFCIISSAPQTARAQNPPCDQGNQSLTFRIPLPVKTPYLSLAMPYEVIIGYVYLDSLCRNMPIEDFAAFLGRRQTLDDSLRLALKYRCLMEDFDPVRLLVNKYFKNPNYIMQPYDMSEALDTRLAQLPETESQNIIAKAGVIAHISVTGIESRSDEQRNANNIIVTGTMNKSIKGKAIPTCKDIKQISSPSEYIDPEPRMKAALDGVCLQFIISNTYGAPPKLDMHGNPLIEAGKEYLVFLDADYICADNDFIYYNLAAIPRNEGVDYVFPVIEGNIVDDENVLKLGTTTPAGELISGLETKISEIENAGATDVKDLLTNAGYRPKVLPNPFVNRAVIEFTMPIEGNASISLYSSLGEKILTINPQLFGSGMNRVEINTEGLSQGIYFYRIDTGTTVLSGKMLKIE